MAMDMQESKFLGLWQLNWQQRQVMLTLLSQGLANINKTGAITIVIEIIIKEKINIYF